MQTIDKCPECGASLEATVKIYLSDIVLNEDGTVKSYAVDEDLAAAFLNHEFPSFNDAIRNMVETADGSELLIYCANDHPYQES